MTTIETTTNALLMHHLNAFGDNNLREIMLDYTEESIVLTDKGLLKGLDKIEQFFKDMFELIPTGSQFEMNQLTVRGNAAHIIWASKSAIADIPFGTDTFILENKKIKVHTVSTYIK